MNITLYKKCLEFLCPRYNVIGWFFISADSFNGSRAESIGAGSKGSMGGGSSDAKVVKLVTGGGAKRLYTRVQSTQTSTWLPLTTTDTCKEISRFKT